MSNMIYAGLFFALIVIVVLFGMKYAKKDESENVEYFANRNCSSCSCGGQ